MNFAGIELAKLGNPLRSSRSAHSEDRAKKIKGIKREAVFVYSERLITQQIW
jgi:hypothetical protein